MKTTILILNVILIAGMISCKQSGKPKDSGESEDLEDYWNSIYERPIDEFKGIDLANAIQIDSAPMGYLENGGLVKVIYDIPTENDVTITDTSYMITNDNTPIGLKHTYNDLVRILEANGLDYDRPFYDDSYMNNLSITDYAEVIEASENGELEILKTWLCCGHTILFEVYDTDNMIAITKGKNPPVEQ